MLRGLLPYLLLDPNRGKSFDMPQKRAAPGCTPNRRPRLFLPASALPAPQIHSAAKAVDSRAEFSSIPAIEACGDGTGDYGEDQRFVMAGLEVVFAAHHDPFVPPEPGRPFSSVPLSTSRDKQVYSASHAFCPRFYSLYLFLT